MEEEVIDAVFGNVGTMMTFRVGAFDSEVLEKEFAPTFMAVDLVSLGFRQLYLKLMIDGVSSQPFSAKSMEAISRPEISFKDAVIVSSREQFARTKEEVEKNIAYWHDEGKIKEVHKEINREPSREIRKDVRPLSVMSKPVSQTMTKEPYREAWRQTDSHRSVKNVYGSRQIEGYVRNPESSPEKQTDNLAPKIDENKQAFIKATEILQGKVSKIGIENPPIFEKTISLSALRQETDKKNPSKENISSLKDALSRVVNQPKFVEKQIKEKPKSMSKIEPKQPVFTIDHGVAKPEVPEKVLRDLLKMEDTK